MKPCLRVGAVAAVGLLAIAVAGCGADSTASSAADGDPRAGQRALEQHGCGTCHVIPGVRAARGRTGPTLEYFARHVYIAGELPNRPDVLIRWLQDPPALVPETAMPDMGVSERQARDMAAYLYTLE